MQGRLDRLEDRAAKRRQIAKDVMAELDLTKITAPDFSASLRPGMPALVVLNEDAVPKSYWEPGEPRLRCQILAHDLKGGAEVAGATERHQARCTTSHSRLQKPMQPKGRWRPSASRSALSSIAAAGQRHCPKSPCPRRLLSLFPPTSGSASTRTTRHLFHGRRATTAVARIWSPEIGRKGRRELEVRPSAGSSIVPVSPGLVPAQIDKSVLAIAEPKRPRDKAHLRFVASQPCLVCGRQPSDPHHLRFAQPRALGLKVSDEFTVPLCRGHHRQLHQAGNEVDWWEKLNLKPLVVAKELWQETHPKTTKRRALVVGT